MEFRNSRIAMANRPRVWPHGGGSSGIAFLFSARRRHLQVPGASAAGSVFHGSMPALYASLTPLCRPTHKRLRMTRGHCGLLSLRRVKHAIHYTLIHYTLPD